MPPSLSAMRRSGNFCSTRDHRRSAAACTMFIGCSVIITLIGASIEVITSCDDEPMCRHTIVPSSLHAFQNGSQCSVWKLGQPSFSGFSEKVTAWQPFCRDAAHLGRHLVRVPERGNASGMKRPGYAPHHSSMCQSL